MPQGQNTLCYLIDLGQQVGIELFKLIMQLEKLWPFHVPVITTYVHVKNLIVGQQDVKLFGELAGTVLMQTDGVGIAHGGTPCVGQVRLRKANRVLHDDPFMAVCVKRVRCFDAHRVCCSSKRHLQTEKHYPWIMRARFSSRSASIDCKPESNGREPCAWGGR